MVDGPAPLARFVPRVACEWDLDAADARWREVEGTLVFIDISGFTNLSERLAMRGRIGVEELTEVLNRVFGAMLEIAYGRSGMLLKFGGDALLLLFTGPDHPAQAACAAVEMRAALRVATSIPLSVGKVHLRMSVGVHSGQVHLFRVGKVHQELIVTGPAATRTTEMEHAASAGEILISPETAEHLPAAATKPGPEGGRLLRWRTAPVPPGGAQTRRHVSADAIEQCVPAVMRDHLRAGDVDFEHRVASVAFIRFQGVDALLAEEGPDAVAAALEELLVAVQVAAEEEDVAFLATDLDENGGKVILVSGVPRAQADDEGRLLRAVRMAADSVSMLSLQIGVHHGHVVAGTIGSPYRATYTVMGDTVNLAARLMAAAPHGEIYATAGVLDRARPVFDVTAVPPFFVKGKSRPVHAYSVADEIGLRGEADAQGPLVGREQELGRLVGHLRSGGAGAQALVLSGATGIGKSRLLEEALVLAGIPRFTVRGEPDGTSTPYRALRDSVRELLGIKRADQETMAEQLRASVERIDASLLPMLPLVGAVAHVTTPPTPEVDAIEPRFLADQRAEVVGRIASATVPGRIALVVEDAHWTDAASEALLERLVKVTGQRYGWPAVVLRRDVQGGFEPSGEVLELGPLSDEAQRELITEVAAMPLRPSEVDDLVARSAGSPIVLHALLRVGRERGLSDLPDSLEALVAAEVDVITGLPRVLLGYASVLGRSFNPRIWEDLLSQDGLEVDDGSLAELEQFLHFDGGGGARFHQAVVRDAAYSALPYRRRRELHLRAGEAIQSLAGAGVDAVADQLAFHFAEGGDAERAWRFGGVAADRARAAYAHEDAAALYARALDAGRRLDGISPERLASTWTALGDVLEQAGRPEEALDAYRRATPLVGKDPVARAELVLKRARVRERSGAFVSALRDVTIAERLLEGWVEPTAEVVRVAAAALRATIHEGQEQPRRALAVATLAASRATELGELRELARALSVMDWAHLELGELDLAIHEQRIAEIYEGLGEPHRAAAALGNQGAVNYWLGQWDEALDCYERAHRAYVQTGDVINAATQQGNVGELLLNRGKIAEARPMVVEAARTHRAVGFLDGALFDEIQVGRLLEAEGDFTGAELILDAVVREARGHGLHTTALHAAIHLADCRLSDGRPVGALEVLEEAEASAGEDAALLGTLVALVRSKALAATGDVDGAAQVREEGIAAARRMGLHYELGLLLVWHDDPALREEGRALLAELDAEPAQLIA
jgi:class 3 adenylate cyclase/tetratricopeptide (TPR) repeat protein